MQAELTWSSADAEKRELLTVPLAVNSLKEESLTIAVQSVIRQFLCNEFVIGKISQNTKEDISLYEFGKIAAFNIRPDNKYYDIFRKTATMLLGKYEYVIPDKVLKATPANYEADPNNKEEVFSENLLYIQSMVQEMQLVYHEGFRDWDTRYSCEIIAEIQFRHPNNIDEYRIVPLYVKVDNHYSEFTATEKAIRMLFYNEAKVGEYEKYEERASFSPSVVIHKIAIASNHPYKYLLEKGFPINGYMISQKILDKAFPNI